MPGEERRQFASPRRVGRVALSKKIKFQQRSEGGKGVNQASIWGKSVPVEKKARANSQGGGRGCLEHQGAARTSRCQE